MEMCHVTESRHPGGGGEERQHGRHRRIFKVAPRFDLLIKAFFIMILNLLTSADFDGPFRINFAIDSFPAPRKKRVDAGLDLEDHELDLVSGKLAAADHGDVSTGLLTEEVFSAEAETHDGLMVEPSRPCCEASTLTDLCYHDDVDEVNLISLVEEQLPRYVLRADTLTDFAGYDNSDWIRTPCLPPDIELALTPELIEETLKYFILCGERVGQMTKTYNDIEAVTRLLEEKERDLELAAKIGQTLLEKNKVLVQRNEELEEQVSEANEQVSQLRHEVYMKDSLLQTYVQDDERDIDSPSTPQGKFPFHLGSHNLDVLQKKVRTLEEENKTLYQETSNLQNLTLNLEEKEQLLVNNVVKQLADANRQVDLMQDDLANKAEVNARQQEEISSLMGKVFTMEGKVKKITVENAELQQHLNVAIESQRQLTTELGELRDKYHECLGLLHESQEDMKVLRRQKTPGVIRQQYGMYSPFFNEGSLAHELEDSLKKEISYPEGYSPTERRRYNKKVMDTAKCVRKQRKSTSSLLGTSPNESMTDSFMSSNRSSMYLSDSDSFMSDAEGNYGDSLGKPGLPGSNDLETALRRLTMRKANEINEQLLREEDERQRKRIQEEDGLTPTGCQTPDSIMSTGSGSNFSGLSGISGLSFRIPEKLQIVKPIEGSITLHQWQRLATPHLGGFLDPRPGVQNKGERPLELDEDVYMLSDIEEDTPDDYVPNPGKAPDWTSGTYTYTTSKIMHPSDDYDTTATTSMYSGVMTASTSSLGECRSVRDMCPVSGTTTFSMNQVVASSLNERGIKDNLAPCSNNPSLFQRMKSIGRFMSIVTETMSECRHSQTEVIYTTVSTPLPPLKGITATAQGMFVPKLSELRKDMLPTSPVKDLYKEPSLLNITTTRPLDGVLSNTAQPLVLPPTLNLVGKLKDSGLEKTGSTTAAQAVLDTGFNSILSVSSQSGLLTRVGGKVIKPGLTSITPSEEKVTNSETDFGITGHRRCNSASDAKLKGLGLASLLSPTFDPPDKNKISESKKKLSKLGLLGLMEPRAGIHTRSAFKAYSTPKDGLSMGADTGLALDSKSSLTNGNTAISSSSVDASTSSQVVLSANTDLFSSSQVGLSTSTNLVNSYQVGLSTGTNLVNSHQVGLSTGTNLVNSYQVGLSTGTNLVNSYQVGLSTGTNLVNSYQVGLSTGTNVVNSYQVGSFGGLSSVSSSGHPNASIGNLPESRDARSSVDRDVTSARDSSSSQPSLISSSACAISSSHHFSTTSAFSLSSSEAIMSTSASMATASVNAGMSAIPAARPQTLVTSTVAASSISDSLLRHLSSVHSTNANSGSLGAEDRTSNNSGVYRPN